ncbi:ABC transporter substrate-binding protein [Paracoccus sp. Z330]|uniref:ABC transporter substrate-binding protein n=1 Tax=Paracoccus onchidii TaxID=3017813 RepID=A0ABT4ZG26_9RHOB|nr:ABC transporter substrate-binding protein [Paracoccus onchidii]MDB6177661.1 ABC transporter substrate-binding protein [Paracoccus onchidii]
MTDKTITNWTAADDAMVEDALRRGASRRDLLRMFMLGGIGTIAGGSILGRATAALAATPVKGGHLRAAGWSSSTADTLDPAAASLATDYVRCCAYYNRLTFLDEHGQLQMELAEAVESDDAKVWTVTLKSGVTFHDGKTLTADDVVFSLQRHSDPAVGSKVAALAKQIAEVKAENPTTVRITLTAPNADLPTILAMHHFMIVAAGTTDFSKGNGTGAFVSQEFQPGVRSVGVRNENYFKPQKAHLDSFEYFGISDHNARVNAVMSGDIHLGASVKPQYTRVAEGHAGVVLSKTTSGNYTNLNMRLDLSPGDKAGFAEGMKYLLDRELIKRSALRGLAEIGNDQPVAPISAFYNANLKPREYDPERAKSLFAKAGVLNQPIEVITSDAAGSANDMAMILQQAGSEIGMNFDVQRVPSDGYWSNYWLKSPVHFGNINPRPTPDILFSLLYASDAPWNESQYKSEKFDSMLLEARGELDFDRRKEIYDEMQVMISNEAGTAIPLFLSNVDVHSEKLRGLRPSPLGGQMGYAFAEYVWLDA